MTTPIKAEDQIRSEAISASENATPTTSSFWNTDLETVERRIGVSEDVINGRAMDAPSALVPIQGCVLERFDWV